MKSSIPLQGRVVLSFLLSVWLVMIAGAEEPRFTRQADVIYGRKYGLARTMDIVRPKTGANGLGVIVAVSGGWFSAPEAIGGMVQTSPLIDRGYTLFAVVHGSQPKFTIPEILEDMHRAVRFIRFHAKEYGIDPDRIGITGGSAGGHLSLMQGNAPHDGNPKSKDPIERVSSRVQAVGCFFPPTDFLNYGKPSEDAIGRGRLVNFAAPFAFHTLERGKFVPVTDEARILEIGKEISPITHVSAKSAPALIIHGNKDELVPIQQAEIMVEKLKAAGVEAKLVVKEGAAHGWGNMGQDAVHIADWFDVHLKGPLAKAKAPAAESTAGEQ
jgi:acetyl esterase/lipase